MTFDEIETVVRELDEGAEVRARADGGFVLSRSGVTVGVAANVNDAVLRRCISDAVIAIGMILVSRAPADDGAWRATIEQRPGRAGTTQAPDGAESERAVRSRKPSEREQRELDRFDTANAAIPNPRGIP